jgi:hypothetical protein
MSTGVIVPDREEEAWLDCNDEQQEYPLSSLAAARPLC